MSTSKSPIWERQGRPKPPKIKSTQGIDYMYSQRRAHIYKWTNTSIWCVDARPFLWRYFHTFAEAISYANKESRSHDDN